jgi:uncharacterized protein
MKVLLSSKSKLILMMRMHIIDGFKGTKPSTPCAVSIEDSYKRLLNPAISNEALQEAKAKADANSIQVLLII